MTTNLWVWWARWVHPGRVRAMQEATYHDDGTAYGRSSKPERGAVSPSITLSNTCVSQNRCDGECLLQKKKKKTWTRFEPTR